MKTIKTICLSLVLVSLLAAGCTQPRQKRYQAEFLSLFDTVTTIVGYADSEAQFKAFAGQVREKLEEYHRLYDIYNNYDGLNNIKTINDNAGKAPVAVDRRIIDLLKFAKDAYSATGGKVNVAMGSVLRLWHDYREAGLDDPEHAELPPASLLEAAAGHADINNVVIDDAASTVFLCDPQMLLDVGAVAKGYAVEQVARYFEDRGVSSLLLSVGGNVRAVGKKAAEDPAKDKRWSIGIQNPDKSGDRTELMQVLIDGLSVVSSGIYERYYTVDGVQYHHIIDPETLMPSAYYAQVTILCRDSGLGDALSTAVFNMPPEESRRFVENLDNVEAVWVMKDGFVEYSSGFKDYVKA